MEENPFSNTDPKTRADSTVGGIKENIFLTFPESGTRFICMKKNRMMNVAIPLKIITAQRCKVFIYLSPFLLFIKTPAAIPDMTAIKNPPLYGMLCVKIMTIPAVKADIAK